MDKNFNKFFSNRIIEYQVEEYKRNLFSKTILHRSSPKNLHEFYEPLFIERNDSIDRIPTTSVKELFKKDNYITLIGNAGSGKSTIVRYLFTKCFEENFKIPIKIELRYLNEYSKRFQDYVFEEVFHFQKLGFSDQIIDRMINSSQFLFFLDGYDELSSKIKEMTTKDIDSFVKKYPKNKYLITSRPYTHVEGMPLFVNFNVSNLEGIEVDSFIKRQIPNNESELANKIIEAINKNENHTYKEYITNPLLLSMFILTFQSYSDIPQKRSDFYEQVFNTLFSLHDSVSKLAYVREKISGLSKDQFEEVLQAFCFISFFDDRFIFSEKYLFDVWNTIKSKKANLNFDNSKLLLDLQVAIAILNKEGLDYTFPHRSLQEFFAAYYISKLTEANKEKIYKKISMSIGEPSERIRFDGTSREHFYLLLSELDERYVIQYTIIPFLDSIDSKLDLDDDKKCLDKYSKIISLFDAFSGIISSQDFMNLKDRANKEFNEKFERKREKFSKNRKAQLSDKRIENARKEAIAEVTEELVRPFLHNFIPTLSTMRKELEDYLLSQGNSDADLIDLV